MICFIRGAYLKEKPCKSMLKHDTKNYFRQFTKTLAFVSSEIQHAQT